MRFKIIYVFLCSYACFQQSLKAVIHGLLFHCVPVFPLEIADVVTDQGTCILPLQSFQIIGRNRLIQNLRDISKSFQTLGDQKKLGLSFSLKDHAVDIQTASFKELFF